jgi:hypothetical protein
MTRTCSFWTVSPRLPDDLRRRSSARDHAGPVSHNHKKRTRGALTASLFVVPAPGPTVPGFLFYLPHLLTLLGVVPAYIRRKQHPIRQPHPMRAGPSPAPQIAAFACGGALRRGLRRGLRPAAQAPVSALGETLGRRPASTHRPHRHHAQHAGRITGLSWGVRVVGRPQGHTLAPAAAKRRPERNTIVAPAQAGSPASSRAAPNSRAAPKSAPATTETPPRGHPPPKGDMRAPQQAAVACWRRPVNSWESHLITGNSWTCGSRHRSFEMEMSVTDDRAGQYRLRRPIHGRGVLGEIHVVVGSSQPGDECRLPFEHGWRHESKSASTSSRCPAIPTSRSTGQPVSNRNRNRATSPPARQRPSNIYSTPHFARRKSS